MSTPVNPTTREPRRAASPQGAGAPAAGTPERLLARGGAAWPVAFATSAALHGLAIALYSFSAPSLPVPVPAAMDAAPERPFGMRVVRLAVSREPPTEVVPPTPPEPVAPETRPDAPTATPAPPEPTPERPTGSLAERGIPPAVERLGVGEVDPRLWAMSPEATRFTPEQRMRLNVLWTLLDMSDSAAAALERERRLTDWTFTDSDGGRWGISQGQVHLGDITLPLPFGFAAPPNPATGQNAWLYREIASQAGAAAARQNFDERVRAIRERLERERRRNRPDSSAGRPPPGPG